MPTWRTRLSTLGDQAVRAWPATLAVALTVLLFTWAMGTPRYGAPDEIAHTTKAYGTALAAFTRQYCLEHHVLIGVGGNFGNVLRIQPPLVIKESELETALSTVMDGIAAYRRQ